MAIIYDPFMGNFCTVVAASMMIAPISGSVVGIMSQLSFDLDLVLMASLCMTIGMSVITSRTSPIIFRAHHDILMCGSRHFSYSSRFLPIRLEDREAVHVQLQLTQGLRLLNKCRGILVETILPAAPVVAELRLP
ncbi:hypothetical protein KIN20_009121 [Parelaphostrongylus tenuis]|uniref:Uncharacterized protein n=1 Tax=Parelaphostrongylus tenuis TaxID=148309 RepID=A0AAD5MQ59_PARTN|nr:hypothetical protein KIN20_009121 [Parelaphostrongylus tenuis]